jgi:shikimate dehydrogenase
MINGSTGLVGLLGNPVQHSLSPAMQNAALQALGLNWRYLALPCEEKALAQVMKGLRAVGCHGLNVTIPHKQAVTSLCSQLSTAARRLQAVNTLIPDGEDGWCGTNTDVEGFLAPLGGSERWRDQQAVVIGCGGSARAVVAGLQTLGLASIQVIGRRSEALLNFIADLQLKDAPLRSCLETDPGVADLLAKADLVVNTTPVGMALHSDASAMPLGSDLWDRLANQATLYDLIYTPRPTAWLRWGQGRGHRCIDGLEMLVEQGAASLRLWSGVNDVPVDTMRHAAETALSH